MSYEKQPRKSGFLKGKIQISEDFGSRLDESIFTSTAPLHGSVISYDQPTEPVSADDWEANKPNNS